MYDPIQVPAILDITVTPNPAGIGAAVLVSVLAVELTGVPQEDLWLSGEILCGEVTA